MTCYNKYQHPSDYIPVCDRWEFLMWSQFVLLNMKSVGCEVYRIRRWTGEMTCKFGVAYWTPKGNFTETWYELPDALDWLADKLSEVESIMIRMEIAAKKWREDIDKAIA
jgi:hypothetical protein